MNAVDMVMVCKTCGRSFWWTVREQHDYWAGRQLEPRWCADCRTIGKARQQLSDGRSDSESALSVPGPSPISADALRQLGHEDLLQRLRDLLLEASEPIVWKEPGLLDTLLGRDPNALEHHRRNTAGSQVNYLIWAIAQCLYLARQHAETEGAILQQQLEARLAVMRAEVERRRLEAEAEQIETQRNLARLQAAAQARALLEPPTTPPPLPSPAERIIAAHREKHAVRNQAEQAMITDFRIEIGNIYMSEIDRHEKAVRIEALMRTYQFGREMLPRLARRLLERVEEEEDRGRR